MADAVAEQVTALASDLDNFWLCQGGAMVLLMGAGFLMLEVRQNCRPSCMQTAIMRLIWCPQRPSVLILRARLLQIAIKRIILSPACNGSVGSSASSGPSGLGPSRRRPSCLNDQR